MSPTNGADAAIPSINGSSPSLHVLMFPFFAFGHISPFVQLSNKLTSLGVTVTFLTSPVNAPLISPMLLAPARVATLELPHVDGLPRGVESTKEMTPAMAELLKLALDRMQPSVRELLERLRPHVAFFDFGQPWLPSTAHPLGIKTVFFSVFTAVSSAFLTVPARRPADNADIAGIVESLRRPPEGFPTAAESSLQSVPPYQAADFSYVFKSFFGGPPVYDRVISCLESCSAIALKSCPQLEEHYINYLKAQFKKPILLAGPVVPEPSNDPLDPKWVQWLDRFPPNQVIFCSFGSETSLSEEAIHELAIGLELTELPFVLVLNFPKQDEDPMVILREKLPRGFEERVSGRGLVHSGWVQQQQMLMHESVGCFVCHAGFSSLAEGMVCGCQLVLLPQRGDQYLNATLFAGDLGVAVQVKRDEVTGGFRREDVKAAVEEVMGGGGEGVREKHNKLRDFLTNDVVQKGFMSEFLEMVKELVKE